MKKIFLLLILAALFPFKAQAHSVSFYVSLAGYPVIPAYGYSYSPYWNWYSHMRLVQAELSTIERLAALGEAQRMAWSLNPSPQMPEQLEAPSIKVVPKKE